MPRQPGRCSGQWDPRRQLQHSSTCWLRTSAAAEWSPGREREREVAAGAAEAPAREEDAECRVSVEVAELVNLRPGQEFQRITRGVREQATC